MPETVKVEDEGFILFTFDGETDLRFDVFKTAATIENLVEPYRDDSGEFTDERWCGPVCDWLGQEHGVPDISWQAAGTFANVIYAERRRLANFTRKIVESRITTESTPEA